MMCGCVFSEIVTERSPERAAVSYHTARLPWTAELAHLLFPELDDLRRNEVIHVLAKYVVYSIQLH